ncbi:sensor histidine kinase [Bacillus sp. FJAT-45350]|uniref:sensor histidine kinase n=1 Tax=Bacillus sp. FJAT-45350 TaxID=2011014 RepID=UPI000BB8E8DB|nr:ATP-binding protein [Bacillus sp. FJAT-45350]
MDKVTFDKEIIGVCELIDTVEKHLVYESKIKAFTTSKPIDSNHSDLAIIIDVTQTLRVFKKLIKNVIEDLRKDSTPLGLSCEQKESQIIFKITLPSSLITDDEIEFIFEKLYQARKVNSSNTGLGLTLAKEIIEKQGGEIWVEKDKAAIYFVCISFPTV